MSERKSKLETRNILGNVKSGYKTLNSKNLDNFQDVSDYYFLIFNICFIKNIRKIYDNI